MSSYGERAIINLSLIKAGHMIEIKKLYASNQIDVTDSLTSFIFVNHILVFVNRFGRSLRFCLLEFDNETISAD